ncbi:MAG: hypothetical protein ACO38U_08595, partial [Burkholderiaceae bacterium]
LGGEVIRVDEAALIIEIIVIVVVGAFGAACGRETGKAYLFKGGPRQVVLLTVEIWVVRILSLEPREAAEL